MSLLPVLAPPLDFKPLENKDHEADNSRHCRQLNRHLPFSPATKHLKVPSTRLGVYPAASQLDLSVSNRVEEAGQEEEEGHLVGTICEDKWPFSVITRRG